jgi:Transposase DDE domain
MSTPARAATPTEPADASGPAAPPLDTYQLFRRLVPPELLNQQQPSAKQTVYTPFVTVWLLLQQRLSGGVSLDAAVSTLLFTFPKDDLPPCKRVQEDTLSANNSAYSKARQRLDLDLTRWLADHVYTSLAASARPAWNERRVQLLDGTTFSLAPSKELRQAFPPASNQYGPSHWPILRVVVAHDLDSGLICRPEYGPMYGDDNECESSLTRQLLPRLPAHSLLLGDGNFGIFIIAYDARQAGHDVLLRLSQPRFRALLRQAKPVGAGRWQVLWQPSAAERAKYQLPPGASVRGYLAEVRVGHAGSAETLYLFTTLEEGTNEEWGQLYGRRWCVETDISVEKVTLGLGRVTGTTAAMVEKEIVLATVAYNLVVQVRRLAAAQAQVEPRRLSFTGTLSLLQAFTAKVAAAPLSEAELQKEFDRLLRACGQRKLPNRPGRHYPREVIPRRRRYPERQRNPAASGAAPSGG